MKVYVVVAELAGVKSSMLAVVSDMDEVERRFGTSWKERVSVYEAEVDVEKLFLNEVSFYRSDTKEVITN